MKYEGIKYGLEETHWLEITTKIGCASQCEYCPQDTLARAYKDKSNGQYMMTLETFEKCLSSVPTNIEIHFTGYCESFLNPNNMDFVEHAVNKGHKILINTTLKGVKTDDIDRLRKLIFEDKKWKGPLTIHLPCQEFTSNIVDKYYYDILEYAMKNLPVKFHAHGTPLEGLEEFIKSHDSTARIKPRGIHSRAGNVKFVELENKQMKFKCPRVWDHVLLPNGDIQLCCVDYGLEVKVGNLLESTYDEIHMTEKFQKILKSGTHLCKTCEI